MNMLLRNLLVLAFVRGRPLTIHDVGRLRLRVWPSDIDVLRHVNNGVYLSLMDLGRINLLKRMGVAGRLQAAGMYPVVASATVSYRKSLNLWQKYTLETRFVGADAKSSFLEQRFVVQGEVYARGIVRARFLRRGGGSVTTAELAETAGVDLTSAVLPDWVERWADEVALPPSRAAAPSEWS